MPAVLEADEVITAATLVRAAPADVYAVVSDPTRIPEWSPECTRVEWVDATHFKGWNRRRLGRWRTTSHVDVAEPDREFTFTVQVFGADWTQWRNLVEPGDEPGTTRLSEQFRMCVPLPFGALVFERLFLGVWDRRADLQANLQQCVARIRHIVERGA